VTKDLVLSNIPFPIAYPLHYARETSDQLSAKERLDNGIFAVYQTMKLAALLMLSDYLAVNHVEPALMARIRGLRAPHWQEWSLLADSLALYWIDPKRLDRPRFRSVAEGWRSVSRVREPGGKTPELEEVWKDLIAALPGLGGRALARSANEAIWELRNRGAHRTGAATPGTVADREAELVRLIPLAETIVREVFGSADFVLLRALPDENGAPKVIELTGPHPDLQFSVEDADPDWAEALAETEVAAQFHDEVLPVYPFLLPAEALEDRSPLELSEQVVMIDGVAESRLTALGVAGGGTVRVVHLDITLAALKRKHGDLSLDRKDVQPWTIVSWARMTAQQTLEGIYNRKYFPSFYLERPGVDDALTRLAQTAGKAMLLIGDAGSGKSSLLARLADWLCGLETGIFEQSEEAEPIVAYLSGRSDYAGTANASADQLLVDAVARKLGIREGGGKLAFASLTDLTMHLQNESRKDMLTGRRIWLLLDGINEADRFLDLVRALDAFLPTMKKLPNFRLAVSMRSGAYFALTTRDEKLGAHSKTIFANSEHFFTFEDFQSKLRPYLEVRAFRELDEGPRAYALRQRALPEKAAAFAYEQLDPSLRRLLLSPLRLHLFHETWANRQDMPGALDEGDLFDAYLHSLTEQIAGAGTWLGRLAHVMLRQGCAFLPVEEAENWVAEWRKDNGFANVQTVTKLDPIEELVASSLLLRPAETGSGLERALMGYQFTNQKLAERILLRHMDSFFPVGTTLPTRALLLEWAQKAAEEASFSELTEAVTAWVRRLMLLGDKTTAEVLDAILDVPERLVNERLINALILSSANAQPSVAAHILNHIADAASKLENGRSLFLLPGWAAEDRVAEIGTLEARTTINRAFLSFSEKVAANKDGWQVREDLAILYECMGDLMEGLGQRETAREWYSKGLASAEYAASMDPEHGPAQRILSIWYNRMGDLAADSNDQETAEDWYFKGLDIAEREAASSPSIELLQHDLVHWHYLLGKKDHASGEAVSAQAWYSSGLVIAEHLASLDPESITAQLDLSRGYMEMGDLMRFSDPGTAREWYGKNMAITQRLAALAPSDRQRQRDLLSSCRKMGSFELHVSKSDTNYDRRWEVAGDWFGRALAIGEALVDQEPTVAQLQRDLSNLYNDMGNLADNAGERYTAHVAQYWYGRERLIQERLAALDPADVQRQLDLFASYNESGDLAERAGHREAAQDWYRRSLAVAECLASSLPEYELLQRNLSRSYWKLGGLAEAAGKWDAAQDWYGKELAIAERLAAMYPENFVSQLDLSSSYGNMAAIALTAGQQDTAESWFRKELKIREHLISLRSDNFAVHDELARLYRAMSDRALANGKRGLARDWCCRCLTVAERLVTMEPNSSSAYEWLSLSYDRMGTLAQDAGEQTEQAQNWYDKWLLTREYLAALNPRDLEAQHDLSLSYDRMGNLAEIAGKQEEALNWRKKGQLIRERLAAIDPVAWQEEEDLIEIYIDVPED
jgi:hypothetical protein